MLGAELDAAKQRGGSAEKEAEEGERARWGVRSGREGLGARLRGWEERGAGEGSCARRRRSILEERMGT